MKKIAIVVQRCGEEIVGGAENYALQTAKILSTFSSVDIITTCAKNYTNWTNEYKAGEEIINHSLRILRFKVDFERTWAWSIFHRMIFGLTNPNYLNMPFNQKIKYQNKIKKTNKYIQRIWMKYQGPYSSDLLRYLHITTANYDAIIFVTYLYPTTFFGVETTNHHPNRFLIPALHDESPVYLSVLQNYKKLHFLFLTRKEQELGLKLFGKEIKNNLIGFGMEFPKHEIVPHASLGKYILYAGRLDIAKGMKLLYEFHELYYAKYGDVKLYTIGDGPLIDYTSNAVKHFGQVSEVSKYEFMAGAIALVHPSSHESLGIVLLEAFMLGVPGVVMSTSDVLSAHIKESGAGCIFSNYGEYEKSLLTLKVQKGSYIQMRDNAKRYYQENYSYEKMVSNWRGLIVTSRPIGYD